MTAWRPTISSTTCRDAWIAACAPDAISTSSFAIATPAIFESESGLPSSSIIAPRLRQNIRRGNRRRTDVATGETKKRPGRTKRPGLWLKLSAGEQPPDEDYFAIPVVAVEPVLVDIVSFFCAQAPKLNAPAATATIMITFKNFTINSPPSLAGCCDLVRRGSQCAQRISQAFFRSRLSPPRSAALDRRAQSDRHSSCECSRGWPAFQSLPRGLCHGCK